MKKTFIIAEIGINHCGDINIAKKLILIAKNSGADAVKFQSYKTENLVTQKEGLMIYQKKNIKKKISQFEMLKKCELTEKDQQNLFHFCKKKKIEFISTPYDLDSANFLINLGVRKIKIASTDTNNIFFIKHILNSNKKIILSTGTTSYEELKHILRKINLNKFKKKINLLHCISYYPAPISILNLEVISKYKKYFKIETGFSDHSLSLISGALAVAHGANMIEKHITLNRNLTGPDHKASLTPYEFSVYIKNIRDYEVMKGNGKRIILNAEKKVKLSMQKSIFLKKNYYKNQIIKKDDIVIMRPATSINPLNYYYLIGKRINKNKKAFSKLSLKDIKK